jgi:hypothetical protein
MLRVELGEHFPQQPLSAAALQRVAHGFIHLLRQGLVSGLELGNELRI